MANHPVLQNDGITYHPHRRDFFSSLLKQRTGCRRWPILERGLCLPEDRESAAAAWGRAFRFCWGKARPSEGASRRFHPAWCHGFDVAAVVTELWDRTPALRTRIAMPFGDERRAGSLVVALAALHDIGKFTLPFQMKVPELWPPEFGPFPSQAPPDFRHDAAGAYLFKLRPIEELLVRRFGPAWEALSIGLLQAVAGHHGRPVATREVAVASIAPPFLMAAVADYVQTILALFMPEPLSGGMSAPTGYRWEKVGRLASWPLSGLMVLADWIGSNQEWFPYADPEAATDAYWADAQRLAKLAVDRCGIGQAAPRAFGGLATLIGERNTPSPMQRRLAEMTMPNGPSLVLVEDVTGSGKTEGAVALAWRFLAESSAAGMVFALPTMATANAMFDRTSDVARTLFAKNASPTLALAHGKAWLHSGFHDLSLGDGPLARHQADEELADDGAFTCPAWLADESRKAFLADLGVSTIDKALLAVLASKFQSVRLAGLIGKLLIVDGRALTARLRPGRTQVPLGIRSKREPQPRTADGSNPASRIAPQSPVATVS